MTIGTVTGDECTNETIGKIGRSASEVVIFELIKSKCLPVLMYGLDAYPTNSADRQSLQFTVNKIIYKILVLWLKTRTVKLANILEYLPWSS